MKEEKEIVRENVGLEGEKRIRRYNRKKEKRREDSKEIERKIRSDGRTGWEEGIKAMLD